MAQNQQHIVRYSKDRTPRTDESGTVFCGECRKQIGVIEHGCLRTGNILLPNATRIRCGTCFTPNYFLPPRYANK